MRCLAVQRLEPAPGAGRDRCRRAAGRLDAHDRGLADHGAQVGAVGARDAGIDVVLGAAGALTGATACIGAE